MNEGEGVKPWQEEKFDRAIVAAMRCGAGAYLLVAACGVCGLLLLEMLGAINSGGNPFLAVVVPASVTSGVLATLAGFWWRYHQSETA